MPPHPPREDDEQLRAQNHPIKQPALLVGRRIFLHCADGKAIVRTVLRPVASTTLAWKKQADSANETFSHGLRRTCNTFSSTPALSTARNFWTFRVIASAAVRTACSGACSERSRSSQCSTIAPGPCKRKLRQCEFTMLRDGSRCRKGMSLRSSCTSLRPSTKIS